MTSNQKEATEKTVIKEFSLCGGIAGGEQAAVDVSKGKVLRIRPLHYDSKYSPQELKTWKIEARGKTFQPLMKSLPSYFALAYKKRVYSPNRILYPLKRIDWDPNGERNPQNRGKVNMFAYPGMRLQISLPVRSSGSRKNMALIPYYALYGDTPNRKIYIQPTATARHYSDIWVAIPGKPAIRIAGKAGTGEPGMSGEKETWDWQLRELISLAPAVMYCVMSHRIPR
jgi:hypothetical protein